MNGKFFTLGYMSFQMFRSSPEGETQEKSLKETEKSVKKSNKEETHLLSSTQTTEITAKELRSGIQSNLGGKISLQWLFLYCLEKKKMIA